MTFFSHALYFFPRFRKFALSKFVFKHKITNNNTIVPLQQNKDLKRFFSIAEVAKTGAAKSDSDRRQDNG